MTGQPGRPREFDETEILTKIMKRFWSHGYEGTSLNDIINVSGLKKGSLYKAFGSKHNMYLLSLAVYEENAVDQALAMLTGSAPPVDRVKTFLSAPIEAAFTRNDRRGCFLCNASSDYTGDDPETLARVRRGYDKLLRGLTTALQDLHPDHVTDKISGQASMLLGLYSGLRIMARTASSATLLEQARDAALESLYG